MRRESLTRYKLQIHVRILKDSHMRYINAGESLMYMLILRETYVLNAIEYCIISHKDGSQY